MSIDPKIRFLIGLIVTCAIGISQGTVTLTNVVPDIWIKPVIAWCGLVAFIGSSIQTTISGLGMGTQSRISAAASLPEVKTIVTSAAIADSSPSNKVVAK